MSEELKPCPFCGAMPTLTNSGIIKCYKREGGDLTTSWMVKCKVCNIKREGGMTYYNFENDETLTIKDPKFDGRRKVIEMWNKRAGAIKDETNNSSMD